MVTLWLHHRITLLFSNKLLAREQHRYIMRKMWPVLFLQRPSVYALIPHIQLCFSTCFSIQVDLFLMIGYHIECPNDDVNRYVTNSTWTMCLNPCFICQSCSQISSLLGVWTDVRLWSHLANSIFLLYFRILFLYPVMARSWPQSYLMESDGWGLTWNERVLKMSGYSSFNSWRMVGTLLDRFVATRKPVFQFHQYLLKELTTK